MPEFNINYSTFKVTPIKDKTAFQIDGKQKDENGKNFIASYYPGFDIEFTV